VADVTEISSEDEDDTINYDALKPKEDKSKTAKSGDSMEVDQIISDWGGDADLDLGLDMGKKRKDQDKKLLEGKKAKKTIQH